MSSWPLSTHRFALAALVLALASEGGCSAAMVARVPSRRGPLGTASRIRLQRSESGAAAASSLLTEAREEQRRRLKELGVDSEDLYSNLRRASEKQSWEELLFGESDDGMASLTQNDITERVREEASAVADLQTATGTEVPDMELHLQMEAARKRSGPSSRGKAGTGSTAAAFIDGHVSDATNIEKVAMSTLPLQLPGPAASVVGMERTSKGERKGSKSAKKPATQKKLSPTLQHSASQRVTPEEEIELARVVQRGSELHRLKTDFEESNGRDITRQEWAHLAGLDSTKELRRIVASYRSAKNKLVTANMGLVHAVVRKQYGAWARQRGITIEELVQEGSLGLIRAAELFDPSRGLRFSTYATIWIKGVLSNSKVDEIISLPARDKTKWNKIRKASADMLREHGDLEKYKPKARDVAMRTGLETEDVETVTNKMKKAQNLLSLDYQYENQGRSGTDSSRVDLHNDRALHADSDLIERLQLRADVIAALVRNLDAREARLVRLRYGLKDGISRSLTECAEAMGISYETARRLSLQCLKKLREADDADSLQEYLLTVA